MATAAEDMRHDEPPVPRWVGVMVAVVLVGGMVGGGALWALSRYVQPDPSKLVEVEAPIAARIGAAIQAPRPPTNGITQTRPGIYQVRAGDVLLSASKVGNATDWTFRYLYNKSDLVSADDQAALVAQMRIGADPAFAKFLKVTDEQLAQLKALPSSSNATDMVVGPEDQNRIKALWTQYIDSQKSESEQAVVKAMQELSTKNLAATRASIGSRAAAIKAILSPEQIATFKT